MAINSCGLYWGRLKNTPSLKENQATKTKNPSFMEKQRSLLFSIDQLRYYDMGGIIAPGCLQLKAHPAVAGH
jgi:hypothetical protein